jgi:DNA processing protein
MNKSMHPAFFWLGLSCIPGVGRATFRKLVNRFGSPEHALLASHSELKDVDGLSGKAAAGLASFPWRGFAEGELAKAAAAGVAIITMNDPAYPERLRNSPDPPLCLYVRGSLRPEDANAVAIVGTRKPTQYGMSVTRRMASRLVSAGLTVVSGMARGIDTEAHKGALAARGRTIAVLGCGIDTAYPPENRGLMEEIVRSGAVITENPFGTRPESGYFPSRNRIISGLSLGAAIIEAAEDSGSLITAKYALEQNRRVFAVPGNIGSPTSRGTNGLIKRGAVLVEGAEDLLRELGWRDRSGPGAKSIRPLPALTREETAVFDCLTDEPKHIDSIMSECGASAGKLSGVLISLELKGLAKQLPGKYFVRPEP